MPTLDPSTQECRDAFLAYFRGHDGWVPPSVFIPWIQRRFPTLTRQQACADLRMLRRAGHLEGRPSPTEFAAAHRSRYRLTEYRAPQEAA